MSSMPAYDKEYGVADARKHFSEVMREVSEQGMRVAIANHGRSRAVMVSVEEWESVVETLDTLADAGLMRGVIAYLNDEARGIENTRDLESVIMDLFGDDANDGA